LNLVADWLVNNRDKIEKGVEIMGQASEVLAATVGQLHPVLEAVFVASAELLSNPDSKEARYLTQQFEMVNQKLEGIQDEIDKLALELQRTQYEKFQVFVNAKPKFKEKKMEKFISHYESTDMDLNLDALYNSVTGENTSGDPMLETVVNTEQRSRRAVEDFCARLKKLFVVGIIAVMGYMVKKWQGRMEEVEKRMKAAVDDCTENFATQAKVDIEHLRISFLTGYQIQEKIEQEKLKGNMMAVALSLNKSFPNCLVHAVSHYKAVVQSTNFQEDCYYFGKHKRAYLCIHPE
uniref:Rapunzel 5 n=1 Tax=Maylandia zebra TaxID=106582 RepID=A0A3P9CIH6_9CICH